MNARANVDPNHPAKYWVPILANYRTPNLAKSIWAVGTSLFAFFILWTLAWQSLAGPRIITFGISLLIGFMLMRLFCLQHDCGHGSLFASNKANTWLGRCLGVLTITPYDVWRKVHSSHHEHSGNLDAPSLGQIVTLTLEQYQAKSRLERFWYRLYRHPVSLLVVAPFWLFFIEYRLPVGLMRSGLRYWVSAMATNITIATLLALLYNAGGWEPILWIFLPSMFFGAFGGVWTFYMHHQFDHTYFVQSEDWQLHDAALRGSSQVVVPRWLQWCTANITIHHVHHLYSRVPFYRLPEVLKDHPELAEINKVSLKDSFDAFRLSLWEGDTQKLITFKQAHRLI